MQEGIGMGRRGDNEGSIYRRGDGRWTAAVTVGYDKNGKQKRKVFYGKTRAEVAQKLNEALQLQRKGRLTLKSVESITLADWLEYWLINYKKIAVKPRTYTSYQQVVYDYLTPELGNILLKDLSINEIQKAINNLTTKVSSRTTEYAISILRQALKQAMAEGYMYNNPAHNIALPRKTQKNVSSLTLEEVKKVFGIIKDPIHYIIYFGYLSTGVRRGELLALKWNDVANNVMDINKAISKDINDKWVVGTLKNKESIRSFAIPDKLVSALKEHKHKQDKQIDMAGKLYNNQNYIFCKDNGELYTPGYITRRWNIYCQKVGIDSNLHELRHTFATMALQNGVDVTTVSKMLGHKDVTTTLNIYSHILPDSTKKAAEIINGFLPKQPPDV